MSRERHLVKMSWERQIREGLVKLARRTSWRAFWGWGHITQNIEGKVLLDNIIQRRSCSCMEMQRMPKINRQREEAYNLITTYRGRKHLPVVGSRCNQRNPFDIVEEAKVHYHCNWLFHQMVWSGSTKANQWKSGDNLPYWEYHFQVWYSWLNSFL